MHSEMAIFLSVLLTPLLHNVCTKEKKIQQIVDGVHTVKYSPHCTKCTVL